ncbi:pentatricopeptide repeat-containing protein At5g67570, chloroplastic [Typha angustifolia]|uniref:pentatricopeptide repeat-containing protein At5g67570, chloroplastic n=1 Tax=Typha angustifolia TaxID=59011 RepID=UPI003C2D8C41
MAVSSAPSLQLSTLIPRSEKKKPLYPTTETLKSRLLRKGVAPTPKILHALRKKETQKSLRRTKKKALADEVLSLSESQRQEMEEEAQFRQISAEYRALKEELAGRPWERSGGVDLRGIVSAREGDGGGRLKGEHLEELRDMLAERNGSRFQWLLEDDVEVDVGVEEGRERKVAALKQTQMGDDEKIELLVRRLSDSDLSSHDWKFPRLMKQSGLLFTEMYLLKIVEGLGALGNWRQALSVVEWVYKEKEYEHRKSRFVYTKLLAVLGKARRATEALKIFDVMRGDAQIYPDMAAYRTIAVTLGQAGFVNELTKIVEFMRQKPLKKITNMRSKNWDPTLEPDVIIYNAVLNACIPSRQWKGVFWVLEQMRHAGIKPTAASYGLSMEVMLNAGKHDLVHKFFEKVRKGGLAPKALTYKVLVRTFWKEGKIDEAVEAVRQMEQRGVVGAASVYYELACCLCNNGRWQDAMVEVQKLKNLPITKPLEVSFTGMILASLDGGYINDCISIFELMKDHCSPNIGTINAMLKVYCHLDMFGKAKELFENIKTPFSGSGNSHDSPSLKADAYTYRSMLEASASALQWEYFEYVYKEMALSGYQLDQRKYAWLLVEASKSGKWYLLEHAFDTILEAGEVPHVSMFAEIICHSIGQNNFGRIVNLINGMAHASFKVSESQWTDLFQHNMDRFSKNAFQDLLNHLSGCNLVMEEPVPDFLRSLQSLCGMRLLKSTHLLADASDVSSSHPTYLEDANSADSNRKALDCFPIKPIIDFGGALPTYARNNLSSVSNVDTKETGGQTGVTSEKTVTVSSCTTCDKELQSVHCNSQASVTDETLDLLRADVRNLFAELPSASEILQKWKQDRLKDDLIPKHHDTIS